MHGGAWALSLGVWLLASMGWLGLAGMLRHDLEGVAARATSRIWLAMAFLGILLCIGLALLARWAAWIGREGLRLLRMDVPRVARVLQLLARSPTRVSYEALRGQVPAIADSAAMDAVVKLPGVIRLESPPRGLCITDRLRGELGATHVP